MWFILTQPLSYLTWFNLAYNALHLNWPNPIQPIFLQLNSTKSNQTILNLTPSQPSPSTQEGLSWFASTKLTLSTQPSLTFFYNTWVQWRASPALFTCYSLKDSHLEVEVISLSLRILGTWGWLGTPILTSSASPLLPWPLSLSSHSLSVSFPSWPSPRRSLYTPSFLIQSSLCSFLLLFLLFLPFQSHYPYFHFPPIPPFSLPSSSFPPTLIPTATTRIQELRSDPN